MIKNIGIALLVFTCLYGVVTVNRLSKRREIVSEQLHDMTRQRNELAESYGNQIEVVSKLEKTVVVLREVNSLLRERGDICCGFVTNMYGTLLK